ncbi:esterase/lipase family protein [Roseateles sp. GG27B]
MSNTVSMRKRRRLGGFLGHFAASDLRGLAQLATQATAGVTRMVEGVHQSVWDTLGVAGGPEPGQTGGITGLAYKSVRGVNQWVGKGLEVMLARLEPQLTAAEAVDSLQRDALLAALNGMLGDHLLATRNPLALQMTLRWRGKALDLQASPLLPPGSDVSGKILLLIHGLCMNDRQWQVQASAKSPPSPPADHGAALARELGYSPVYLRYNSGLHISQNGRELAAQLEQMITHWPVPVEELSVVAHSMGGLLIRSACHYAHQGPGQSDLRWLGLLKNIVFLGTPHHGAPLERAGNWIDVLLGSTPYTAPLAKLGQLRSAGITDLRHGSVRDEDWQGQDRFHRQPNHCQQLALPAGVACYAVAATTAAQRSTLANRLIGDGLVPLHSALGEHDDPNRCLHFAQDAQWIAYRMNHLELLNSPAVTRQLLRWLAPTSASASTEADVKSL